MKAFVLSYGPLLNPVFVQQVLNGTQAIQTWVAPFPNSSILISRLTLLELTAVLRSHFGEAWFLLVETNADNCNGWLPAEFWEYLTNPQVAWSKQFFKQFLPPPPPPLPNA